MSRIFLSHSSKDSFEALALRDWLAAEGWNDVFLDLDPNRGIAAGERWERALHTAATRCEAVIFLVSGQWLASGWCLREYALARGLNKKLFAVLIDAARSIDDLPPELKGTWQVIDLARGQDLQLFRTLLPGSHEEKHVGFARHGLQRLKRGLEKAGLDPKFFAWPPDDDRNRSPYRGLKPLEAVDAGIFFGRDAPIVETTDRLRRLESGASPRLLVILGASGAGKSSFLRAGLLPRLARDDGHFIPLPVIRPERAALYGDTGLLAALAGRRPARTRAARRAALQAGAASLRTLLAELAAEAAARQLTSDETARPPAIVIAIDQAEELFRADGAVEGSALLALLRDLTASDNPAVIAIFAIRSDAYDALEHAEPLKGLPQATLPLLPMPRGAYVDVIEGPAHRLEEAGGKLAIEPQLTQHLLADIEKGGGSDALPLLAFTLEQLYLDYRQSGGLRLADYHKFGGLKGAIDAAVERAFARADADARIPRDRKAREALLRRGLIPWLAGVDPDSKSPRRNIARRSDIPAEAVPLIDLLVEERLLSSDTALTSDVATGQTTRVATIEPTHEALLRQWGLLQGWLADDLGLLTTLESVKRAARDWEANARVDAWLSHQGQRLTEAQALDARPDIAARLDPIDRAYLAQCRAREEAARAEADQRRHEREAEQARQVRDARRIAQRTAVGLAAALVLAIAAGVFGFYAQSEKTIADQKTQEAQKQRDAADQSTREAKAQRDAADAAEEEAQTQRDSAASAAKEAKLQRDAAETARTDAQSQRDAAERQKAVAEAQRERADKDLAAATRAVDEVVIGIAEGLQDVAGLPVATITHVLETAKVTVDDLAASQPDDEDLQRSREVMLGKFADIYLKAGDSADAENMEKQSLTIARKLAEDLGTPAAQFDLSVSLTRAAKIRAVEYDEVGAEANLQESLAIVRTLAEKKSDPRAQRGFFVSLEDVGDSQMRLGDTPRALQTYEEGLDFAHKNIENAADDKTKAQAQRDLADALARIGFAKDTMGDLPGALAAYEQALPVIRALIDNADHTGIQDLLSNNLMRIGAIKETMSDLSGALAAYQESVAVARKLAGDQNDAPAQHQLMLSLANLGATSLRHGDISSGFADDQEALDIARDLAKDKNNAKAQSDLAGILMIFGTDYYFSQHKLDDAFTMVKESLAISEDNSQRHPENVQAKADLVRLGGVFNDISYYYLLGGHFQQALDSANLATSIDPQHISYLANQADALMLLGRTDDARTIYLAHRGQEVSEKKSWEADVLGDFADLRKAGFTNPLMDEMEAAFAAPKPGPARNELRPTP
jgi:tetratricopeptide (TPR) repeat protein